tara:strand:+ start:3526 stop:4419 length:894 start_codon:yes stop_codon:yes gene_type:complete
MNVRFYRKSTPLAKQRDILVNFCQKINDGEVNAIVEDADRYIDCDVAVIFGSWKKSPKKKWKMMLAHHFLKAEIVNEHRGKLIVIETPLLNRTISDDGLHDQYRVGLNHFMRGLADFKNTNSKPDRFNKLNIDVKPWRKSGDHVLIVGQNLFDASLFGIDFSYWVENTTKMLLKHTNRKIVIRDHPENKTELKNYIEHKFGHISQVEYSNKGTIYDDLKNAHCTVSYTSGSSIDSIIAGVPVIPCSEYNFLWPISSHSLSEIENPKLGEREQLLYDLAYTQWSVEEINQGKPWEHLI